METCGAYWTDTHCHLNFDCFTAERGAVIERALAAGVRRQISISTRLAETAALAKLAEEYPSVFFTAGIHPCNAHEKEAQNADLISLLLKITQRPKCVGIGESGLDYHYSRETAALQRQSFCLHIAAARQTQLPLVIHSREADADMAAILREESEKGAFPFVLHCYSSGLALAEAGLALGGYISFSGIATFKNAPQVREAVKLAPRDRVLVETDAPYLAPVPYRGKVNEPAYTAQTGAFLADFLGLSEADFARQTTENAYRLFNKMTRA